MFDNEIILIKKISKTGKLGIQESKINKRKLLCAERSAYKRDKAFARGENLNAKYVVKVHSFEYDDETLALYNGQEFIISDVDMLENETCELTLSQKLESGSRE